jgi:hypothetical protein
MFQTQFAISLFRNAGLSVHRMMAFSLDRDFVRLGGQYLTRSRARHLICNFFFSVADYSCFVSGVCHCMRT